MAALGLRHLVWRRGGARKYLDRDYQVALKKLRRLRAESERDRSLGGREWLDATFCELADFFLEDVKSRRAIGTFRNYRFCLLRALKILGPSIRVGEIRKIHLAQIEQELRRDEKLGDNTIIDTIAVTQRVLSWAVRHDWRKPTGCVSEATAPRAGSHGYQL